MSKKVSISPELAKAFEESRAFNRLMNKALRPLRHKILKQAMSDLVVQAAGTEWETDAIKLEEQLHRAIKSDRD